MNVKTTRSKKKKTNVKAKIPLISFDSWFWFKEQDSLVSSRNKTSILAFFKSKGLKDEELRSIYDETLKNY